MTTSLLIITGSMGAGKSTVLGEASDLLASRRVAHAAIDVDGLGLAHLPSAASSDELIHSNLRSVCENYRAAGVQRFLLACAIEDRAQLELCRAAASATEVVVCRLTASVETMQKRVGMRESGVLHREFVAHAAKLNGILDGAQLQDFVIENEGRALTDVTTEMLVKAGRIAN